VEEAVLCFWSAKGGVGCSVVAAAVALLGAERGEALLVDLVGDQPAILGLTPSVGPGLTDWLARDEPPPPDALARLERRATDQLGLLAVEAGTARPPVERVELLGRLLAQDGRFVVVDLGRWDPGLGPLTAAAEHRLLVTRLCYLGLRAASTGPVPTGVVVVAEAGRALRCSDVSSVVDAPVVARVPVDPVIARVVDAGLLASRLPRPLRRLAVLRAGSVAP
jgi:hypothetical protein